MHSSKAKSSFAQEETGINDKGNFPKKIIFYKKSDDRIIVIPVNDSTVMIYGNKFPGEAFTSTSGRLELYFALMTFTNSFAIMA